MNNLVVGCPTAMPERNTEKGSLFGVQNLLGDAKRCWLCVRWLIRFGAKAITGKDFCMVPNDLRNWSVFAYDRRNIPVACEELESEAAADHLVLRIRREGIPAVKCPICGEHHRGVKEGHWTNFRNASNSPSCTFWNRIAFNE